MRIAFIFKIQKVKSLEERKWCEVVTGSVACGEKCVLWA